LIWLTSWKIWSPSWKIGSPTVLKTRKKILLYVQKLKILDWSCKRWPQVFQNQMISIVKNVWLYRDKNKISATKAVNYRSYFTIKNMF